MTEKGVELKRLESAAIAIVLAIVFIILFNFQWFPFAHINATNADALFMEDVARDVVRGGALFNWRLTQAPYLFPDIFLMTFIAPFTSAVGNAGVYYQMIFGVLLIIAIGYAAKLSGARPATGAIFAAVIYITTFVGLIRQDVISLYFGLVGHHSGVGLMALLLVICLVLSISHPRKEHLRLAAIVISFLGAVSDALIPLTIFPTIFALIFISKRAKLPISNLMWFAGAMLFGVFLGKIFGYSNPFPQDREFFARILSQFPSASLNSALLFLKEITAQIARSEISLMIFALYLFFFSVSWRAVLHLGGKRDCIFSARTVYALFVLTAFPVVLFFQLALGIYGSIDSSRQWAPILYVSIALGGIVYAGQRERASWVLNVVSIALSFSLLLLATKFVSGFNGRVAEKNAFENVVECMKKHELPAGAGYVSDYWLARPIRLYSAGFFDVVPVAGVGSLFTNAANIVRIRESVPKYAITGVSLTKEGLIERFGPPAKVFCENTGHPVFDYSGVNDFEVHFLNLTKHAY